MGTDRENVAKAINPIILNLGCGYWKDRTAINVDFQPECEPDVLWDLTEIPWPWKDNSIDTIYAFEVFEHLENWYEGFKECARILKLGGFLTMSVPDHTRTDALAYIDHKHILHKVSFHGTLNSELRGHNAWAVAQKKIPLKMVRYERIPYPQYWKWWFPKWLLSWCMDHMVNFAAGQKFVFQKVEDGLGNKS